MSAIVARRHSAPHVAGSQRLLGMSRWQKMLERWATVAPCGESRLLVYVIAEVIAEYERRDARHGRAILGRTPAWLTCDICRLYCAVLGIGHEALLDAIVRARWAYADGTIERLWKLWKVK